MTPFLPNAHATTEPGVISRRTIAIATPPSRGETAAAANIADLFVVLVEELSTARECIASRIRQPAQMPIDMAAEMNARDGLLSGVAAFRVRDGVELIEVRFLRESSIRRCRCPTPAARLRFAQCPTRRVLRAQHRARTRVARLGCRDFSRHDQLVSLDANVGHAHREQGHARRTSQKRERTVRADRAMSGATPVRAAAMERARAPNTPMSASATVWSA